MKIIPVKSLRGSYSIAIGSNLLSQSGALVKKVIDFGKILVVTHPSIARLYLKKVQGSLAKSGFDVRVHLVPEGETAKSEKSYLNLLKKLVTEGFERRDLIFALGGGVVGDLSGFSAASYLRGIPFVNAGTTLLAQVDSSIGGKTGINLTEGKNLVGAFYPPRLVISDIETLKTLPDREFRSSLGEVVKYGVIRDTRLFQLLETQPAKVLKRDKPLLEEIVIRSAAIKAGVVTRDEFETKGERMILNFGHTFGHGFEQALGYKRLLHGEAVAIGMAAASSLAQLLGLFSKEDHDRLLRVLKSLRLPDSLKGLNLSADSILSSMARDKKKKGGKLRFILPIRIGKVIVRDDIPNPLIEKILRMAGAK